MLKQLNIYNLVIVFLFFFAFMISLESCTKDQQLESDLQTELTNRNLGCISACNSAKVACLNGDGQDGNSYADYKEWYDCRCVEFEQGCEYPGNYTFIPKKITCDQLQERLFNWKESCTIAYVDCVDACGTPHQDGNGGCIPACPPNERCENGICKPK